MMMIKIERANIEEAEAIRQLLRETWMDTYAASLSERTVREVTAAWHNVELLKSQIENPAIFFGVTKDEANILVGLITARSTDGNCLVIYRLYVRPKEQRKGIGTKLLTEALCTFPRTTKIYLE